MIDLYPNVTFFIQWALFLVVFLVLRQAVFLPTLRILRVRKTKTEGEREIAVQLEKETERMILQIEAAVVRARSEGIKIKERLRQEAGAQQALIVARVRENAQKNFQEVQKDIEKKGREVSFQLRQYAQQLGKELAEKILERPI